LPSRSVAHEVVSTMASRSGWILRHGVAAAVLAILFSLILPWTWKSTAVLLPADRRTDEFHYRSAARSGLVRLLESFRLHDRTHPEEIDHAVLTSDETVRRLVERFELQRRWKSKTMDDAMSRLRHDFEIELVAYGPLLVHARTENRQLSADLANAAAHLLDERLDELHVEGVTSERGFLSDAIRDELDEAAKESQELAEYDIQHGLADAESEDSTSVDWAVTRAAELAAARVRRSEAERRFGRGSALERDAERRVDAMLAVEAEVPDAAAGIERDVRAAELKRTERIARLVLALRNQSLSQQALRTGDVRFLDAALPADFPEVRPFLLAGALAFAAFPVFALLQRFANVALPRRSSFLVIAAVLAGILFARVPLALAATLLAAYVLVIAIHLPTAWFLLIAFLPWAWDYLDVDRGIGLQIPTEPGIIVLVFAWMFAIARFGRFVLPKSRILLAAAIAMSWIALTAIPSVDWKHSLFQLVSIGGFVLAGCAFPILEIRDLHPVRRVLYATIFSAAVLSLYGIVQIALSPLAFDRAAFFMGEPLLYDHGPYTGFLGFGFGSALVLVLSRPISLRSAPLVTALLVILLAIVLSLTRAAWISSLILLLIAAALRARTLVKKLAPALIFVGVVAAVFLGVTRASSTFEEFLGKSVDPTYGSNVERLNRWRAGIAMIKARPLMGVGPGAYETAYPDYRDASFVSPQSDARMGAHSDLIRAGAEQGLPGIAALVLLVAVTYATVARLVRNSSDPEIRTLAVALAAGLFTYTIHGLFNEYWRVTKVALTMWTFVGLIGALEQIDHFRREGKGGASGPPPHRLGNAPRPRRRRRPSRDPVDPDLAPVPSLAALSGSREP
jgi:O-antigen ligase